MEHNLNKFGPTFNAEHSQVKVTFEGEAEVIGSEDSTHKKHKKVEENEEQINHAGEDLTDHQDPAPLENRRNHKKPNKHQNVENSLENHEKTEFSSELRQTHPNSSRDRDNNKKHRIRHHKTGTNSENLHRRKKLEENLTENQDGHEETTSMMPERKKRDTILDTGIHHGGNAYNWTENLSESVSFFHYFSHHLN